ncbi:tRNA (adenosine(37)-N6)-threonylcarbamoyltransferase complex ATPase subunit type 1 TsaE [Oceanomicrobium pacificus]|uniref:tRNA threonylcarbamoyladenosine biosynthesis protein TsaE n=1 Tax=Oceanomicrobium pacificus TaxID=2692916 RepID=A0A6B0TU24_9RHOB|nr:tRNA (adenosine(37)-N6)-threonylcarbamoyltransferase complex ATPase subunit type 1 TsaE [Oceanomicrobium pacificus]MXU64742.1 tRNA (adenosine(37)-N6)-threonylcarbamoyltransferase complex ATPase subunit type 1 TsaE [Oceanomicrobium pacificus]
MPQTTLTDADDTAARAVRLAPLLGAGDTICLTGPVGAGKTHFARALIQARLDAEDRWEDVPSPSYTLVQVYDLAETEIWHVDLYRLTDPDETIELGLDQAFDTAICLIEWPDRLGGLLPARRLDLRFDIDAQVGRRGLDITATGPGWDAAVTALTAGGAR